MSQITEFYEGNGIDIRELLELKIKLIDFQHPYLLNRLKYLLLRTLTECTAGNKEVFLKIRLQIPLELLKINLIWLYEDYLAEGHQYTEELVLRPRESWEKVVCQSNLSVLFLRLGFYYFSLIEIFESEDKDEEPEETESFAMNEEKEK